MKEWLRGEMLNISKTLAERKSPCFVFFAAKDNQ